MFDVNDVGALLHIAEKTLSFPKLKSLHDQAMTRLLQIAEDMTSSKPTIAELEALLKEENTNVKINPNGSVTKVDEPTSDVRRV